jgi:hypothetical protein
MGKKVMAKSSGPVDLIATRQPEATAQDKTVVVTAPVVFADTPEQCGEIRLTLTFEQAEVLAAQLQPVARTVRIRSQQRK